MGDFFEIGKMAVQKGGTDGEEVAVARVVDFDCAPWVLASRVVLDDVSQS